MEIISMLMAGFIFLALATAPAAFAHGALAITLSCVYILGVAVTAGVVRAAHEYYGDDVFLCNEDLNYVFMTAWPVAWPLFIVFKLGYWVTIIFA